MGAQGTRERRGARRGIGVGARRIGAWLTVLGMAGSLAAAPPAAAQGAVGPELQSVSPAAWPDTVFVRQTSGTGAAATQSVTITGVGFGLSPGRVFITDGATTLVATVPTPTAGSTGAAAGCEWTPTAITLTAACVGASAGSGGAGVLAPGDAWVQVQTPAGTSNPLPLTVQPQVASLAVAVTPGSAPAGTPQTVTVSLAGPGGSVDGFPVALSVQGQGSGGGPELGATTLTTGAGGQAQTTVTDTVPEADTITARYVDAANGHTVTATATARFSGTCANVSAIAVTAPLASGAAASGSAQAVAGGPTLPLRAAFTAGGGVGIAGLPVVWRISGGPGASLQPRTGITGAQGTAASALVVSAPGLYTVSAACPGGTVAPGVLQVNVAPAAAVDLRLLPAAATLRPGQPLRLAIRATNPLTGRPLAGLAVRLRAFGAAAFAGGVQGETVTTGSDGAALAVLRDAACQQAVVTATLSPGGAQAGSAAPQLVAPAQSRLQIVGCRLPPRPSGHAAARCPGAQPFADVGPGPVAVALCVLYRQHLIAGIARGGRLLYEPGRPATLADVAATVTGVLGVYGLTGMPPCAVAGATWAAAAATATARAFAAVAAASPHCALSDPADVQDAASVLVHALDLEGSPLPASPATVLAAFPGASGAAAPLRADLAVALVRGLLPLAGSAVAPTAILTRGQWALLAFRAWWLLRQERAEVPVVQAVHTAWQPDGGSSLTVVGSGFGWQPAAAAAGNGTLQLTVCPPPTAASGAGAATTQDGGGASACWVAGGTVGAAGTPAASGGWLDVVRWGDRRLVVAAVCRGGPLVGTTSATGAAASAGAGATAPAACAQPVALPPGDVLTLQVTNPVSGRVAHDRWVVGD